MRIRAAAILALLLSLTGSGYAAPVSKPITEVLREPLPPEDLVCLIEKDRVAIQGPTFRYDVDRASGAIARLEVKHGGEVVVDLEGPSRLCLDDGRLSDASHGSTKVVTQTKEKAVLHSEGTFAPGLPYTLLSTFFNDGVVVCEMTLLPQKEYVVRRSLRHEVRASGRFGQYLHKRRDTNGMDCLKGALPGLGEHVALKTLTSCLEVFGQDAALAIFTDRGGSHRSSESLPTASLEVNGHSGGKTSVQLTQHLVHIEKGGEPFTLHKGDAFTFRFGMAVAPNRLPHRRWRDLRMFIWIGDGKHPYPSDEEIYEAAHLGFTLFQMHRLGTPGVPRPPEAEFTRVLKTVHEAGMLFVWTANADLMYANAEGVQKLQNDGEWSLWQGFNYGGKYKAKIDPYCDLLATCLASPNGLADYRIQSIHDMLSAYPVDGMYIDDNLPYANCTLWEEHGHPEQVYDCLIELHEMNWRRRQALRKQVPHAVLIDHCTKGIILPAIAPFDVHLFGEGYSFSSLQTYWDTFGTLQNLPAQGCLWAGDSEAQRCASQTAYVFDLLTGGGQYSYLDWRLWPDKFPHASGVQPTEPLFVRTYNLAQYYFGMHESKPHYFADQRGSVTTSAPNTFVTVYENTLWNEALIVVANLGRAPATTSLENCPSIPALRSGRPLSTFDIHQRTAIHTPKGKALAGVEGLVIKPMQLKLLYVREAPPGRPFHQWGGKRCSEEWDNEAKVLTLTLSGPAGLEDTVFFQANGRSVEKVLVAGKPARFFTDPASGIIHGNIVFGNKTVTIQVICADSARSSLAEQPVAPDQLTREVLGKQ